MNILYCGDKNIQDGLIISILSLLKNVKDILHIYVLTVNTEVNGKKIEGVPKDVVEKLDRLVKEKDVNNSVTLIDITDLFNEEVPKINIKTKFTPCCMLRLYADEIEELPDKILYFDNDVVVRQDINDFYNQNIEEFELLGVLDHYGKWFFKNNFFKFDYINSGVLLLNLKKIKETELFKKCRQRCMNKKMFMPDQSAINKLAKNKMIFPRIYNEQRKLMDDTIIQHFSTNFRFFPIFRIVTIKPWNIEKVHKKLKIFEYDDILEQYTEIKNKELVGGSK